MDAGDEVNDSVGDGGAAAEIRDAVARTIGAGSIADAIVGDLLTRHAETHRRYHTADHVMWVLRLIARSITNGGREGVVDRDAIDVAALFHDAIYDPRSGTNEADSAALAAAHLERAGWDVERVAMVKRLIVTTAGHVAANASEAILLDADLAILGAKPDDYADYARAVRAEYVFVDDERWRVGRAEVLADFLDRDAIFATPMMSAERESQARANLAAELAVLRSPSV